jgi:hypothetical protein
MKLGRKISRMFRGTTSLLTVGIIGIIILLILVLISILINTAFGAIIVYALTQLHLYTTTNVLMDGFWLGLIFWVLECIVGIVIKK